MSEITIPFNKPTLVGTEMSYMADAMSRSKLAGDGYYTAQCNEFLQSTLGVPKALLTTSCTHALEMSALLLHIKPGDEVIIPDFTFVSSINAFVLRGAAPVYADVRPDTLNLDETKLEQLITPRTRAIVLVHYAGVACEMDVIMEIAERHHIPVIEDNAHGLFAKYKGKSLGTFGVLATQSFHETKNFTCGEGGALLINDPQLVERAEIIREKGTNRSRFFRGQVDKYTWVDIGSSYLPSEILAAFLYAQFERREEIQSKRKRIWNFYSENLSAWAEENNVQLPAVPNHCEQPYHMFYVLLPSLEHRQALIEHLKSNGIQSVFHYLPLHLSEMGQCLRANGHNCPVTTDVSDRLLRLPFFNSLTEQELSFVGAKIRQFRVR
jgi:dTDP-4-amino-4,6-dideoxygalactose transaminase